MALPMFRMPVDDVFPIEYAQRNFLFNQNLQALEEEVRRVYEENLEQLVPCDPVQRFPQGVIRAATLTEADWEARRHSRCKRMAHELETRPMRSSRRTDPYGRAQHRGGHRRPTSPNDPQRPMSPSLLPGVQAIPKELNYQFRGLLVPGNFYAKSFTRYLGPFEVMPTHANLPPGDNFVILQKMGILPGTGKSIFRQVGSVNT